jgi:hypothetical protein
MKRGEGAGGADRIRIHDLNVANVQTAQENQELAGRGFAASDDLAFAP